MKRKEQKSERGGKGRKKGTGRTGEPSNVECLGVFGVESPTVLASPADPMIGHIPFVSSSPSSTAGPSLFRDKLVCQNQQERE